MLKLVLTLLLVLLVGFNSYAQSSEIPALQKELEQTKNPDDKIQVLNKLVKAYANHEPHTAINFGLQAIELAICHDNQKLMASSYHNLGTVYQLLGNYKTASEYNFKALEIREAIGDSLGICTSYNNIGNINNYLEDYQKARTFYTKSYDLAVLLKNKMALSRALNNLGYTFEVQDKYEQALVYYNKALPLKEEIGDTTGLVVSLINIGQLYVKQGKPAKGIPLIRKALRLSLQTNNQLNAGYAYRGLAEAYQKAGDLEQAIKFAHQSLVVAEKFNSSFEMLNAADVLNSVYQQAGNYKKAHYYLTLSSAYKDSLQKESNQKQFEELQVKYESDKKEKENSKLLAEGEVQLKELKNQKKIIYLIGALLITFAALAFEFMRGKRRFRKVNVRLARKNDKISRSRKKMRQQQKALVLQAAQLQEQKELLEKSNHVKDKLFSIVAHDLRSPLASLSAMTRLMRTGAIPENRKDSFLEMLELEQQNSLWLIDNLFLWAKTQMSGAKVQAITLNLQQLVQENIRLLAPQAQKKSIQLDNIIQPDQLAVADKEMIKLVLRNLISNAIKFCSEGDSIVVAAKRKDDQIQVCVQDTGVGIREDLLKKLFRSNFTQRGTAHEKGSGLGLQLCKDFVELNGGDIWVESEAGVGSTFYFTLPAPPPPLPAHIQKQLLQAMCN